MNSEDEIEDLMTAHTTTVFVPAGPEKADLLAEIIRDAWTEEAQVLQLTEQAVPRFPAWANADNVADWLAEHDIRMYLMYDGETPVACGGHSDDLFNPNKGWINRISVLTEHQKRGNGRKLVLYLEDCLRAQGKTKVRLGHVTANSKLHEFYKRLHYVTVEVQHSDTWFMDITYMEKDL